MSSFGLRLKLDLSDIHPSIDNPIQWLFVDLNHLKIASDISRHLRTTYFQDRNLKETEIELFLGDGLIPPNTSLKIFKSDEQVKVKVKKKARSVDPERCTGCGTCLENCPVINQPYPKEVHGD